MDLLHSNLYMRQWKLELTTQLPISDKKVKDMDSFFTQLR